MAGVFRHPTPLHEARRLPRRQVAKCSTAKSTALQGADSERVFEDCASSATSDGPDFTTCLDYPRRNADLVVLELDRVGRLVGELISLINELSERGIGFRALNSPMDTTTSAGRALLQIQAASAEMEGNVIRQRVRQGTIAA